MAAKNVTLIHQIQASERAASIAELAAMLVASCDRLLELEPRVSVEMDIAKTHLAAVGALAAESIRTLNALIDVDGAL